MTVEEVTIINRINYKKSKPLRVFKKQIGQANHFLVTILIGLDGVRNGTITKSDGFSTSWNPENLKSSADRSREFAVKSALSWSIDALDSYLIMTQREPKLIQDHQFQVEFGKTKHSVYEKLLVFCKFLSLEQTDVDRSLVELAINWRNRMVHHFAENEFSSKAINTLVQENTYIKEKYSGLDIEQLLLGFEISSKNPPRFKEVTSLINAIINLVYKIDNELVKILDEEKYTHDVIKTYVVQQCKARNDKGQKRCKPFTVLKEVWSTDKERKVYSILSQFGYEYYKTGKTVPYVEEMLNLSLNEIATKLDIQDIQSQN